MNRHSGQRIFLPTNQIRILFEPRAVSHLVKDLVRNHGAKVVFGISGDSGHLNKVKTLDLGHGARWNPTGQRIRGIPSIFQGAVNFPYSLPYVSSECDQAGRDPAL